jgi:hypothetical protein
MMPEKAAAAAVFITGGGVVMDGAEGVGDALPHLSMNNVHTQLALCIHTINYMFLQFVKLPPSVRMHACFTSGLLRSCCSGTAP